MTRVYNFGAGPAALPEEILLQAQEELLDWNGQGMSVIEISNRSSQFMDLLASAEQDLRDILNIPDNYHVLFTVGPARAQFAMAPMNLLRGKSTADYFDTGIWSHMAIGEAKRYCDVNVAMNSEPSHYQRLASPDEWQLNPDAAYLYYTSNETINGVEFHQIPETNGVPLVSDMTSNLLSKPIDISQYGLIFAGAQKNIGPSGLTLVIVRDDLVGDVLPMTPTVYDYSQIASNKSLLYTNNSFACYMAALMFAWIKHKGGLETIYEINQRKAQKLYDAIDSSDFYINTIDKKCRSMMNVPFLLPDQAMLPGFLEKAHAAGFRGLKGHRYVGGLRASLYNTVTEKAVDALIEFMQEFEENQN